jgi:hypothetical protein
LITALNPAGFVSFLARSFIIFLRDAFPINVLKAVISCPTVCRVFCATANPTAVVVCRDDKDRRGIMGVLDGFRPLGLEDESGEVSWYAQL